jgi:uncharacterized protein (TIGR02284 family)
MAEELDTNDMNRDPITNEPGAHPVGTGVGAAAGALAGVAAGAFAGPVGAAVGLVAGAVMGGLGGKASAEEINPTAEAAYWRESYTREPYYVEAYGYDDYGPAYEYGWSSRAVHGGTFDSNEPRLGSDWAVRKGVSGLAWDDARHAARAAWDRIDTGYSLQPVDNDEVIDTLNDLLETSRDGEFGFREIGEHTKSQGLRVLFTQRAQTCREAAAELEAQVRRLGGKPAEGGTASGALHRGWVHARGSLGGLSDEGMLQECERGEDSAVARFRKALKQDLPADVRPLVERLARGAQRNHDQIKLLRDEYKDK